MKYLTQSLLFIIIIFTSCKNEDYIISEEIGPSAQSAVLIQLEGFVAEEFSDLHYNSGRQSLSNVSVRLMHEGVELDKVNTDDNGKFIFPEQAVPIEEAYLILSAPNFHKNVSKLNNSITGNNFSSHTMIRKTFEGLTGDAIKDDGSYIRLIMGLADFDNITPMVYYLTNKENELIGAARHFVESLHFDITTLANEPIILHYLTECSDQSIEIGPFSEDTDISGLLSEIMFDAKDWDRLEATAYDCDGELLTAAHFDFFIKIDELTSWFNNGSGATLIHRPICQLERFPDLEVSLVTKSPRRYGTGSYNYLSGQVDIPAVTICEEDDTYFNYNLGGIEEKPELFTYANVLSDGTIIIKQKGSEFPSGNEVALQILNNDFGATLDIRNLAFVTSDFRINGHGMSVNITLNDGEFIEGIIEGEVLDGYESGLGILSGSFRARIL